LIAKRKVVGWGCPKLNIYCKNKFKSLENSKYRNKESRKMDWRLLIVLLPLLLAAGWAAKNILPLALRQAQVFLDKAKSS
jgi:photosystem II PsbY protein